MNIKPKYFALCTMPLDSVRVDNPAGDKVSARHVHGSGAHRLEIKLATPCRLGNDLVQKHLPLFFHTSGFVPLHEYTEEVTIAQPNSVMITTRATFRLEKPKSRIGSLNWQRTMDGLANLVKVAERAFGEKVSTDAFLPVDGGRATNLVLEYTKVDKCEYNMTPQRPGCPSCSPSSTPVGSDSEDITLVSPRTPRTPEESREHSVDADGVDQALLGCAIAVNNSPVHANHIEAYAAIQGTFHADTQWRKVDREKRSEKKRKLATPASGPQASSSTATTSRSAPSGLGQVADAPGANPQHASSSAESSSGGDGASRLRQVEKVGPTITIMDWLPAVLDVFFTVEVRREDGRAVLHGRLRDWSAPNV
ncbi:hypothetical protein PsYK624_167590 [Phanerochaete sordida]|uniref:Uncharacterized protein n=1 Tax=Phanerochaete sordida TaxID=48140 RepID=A0A9P3GXF4_9APHY|nr:hypothetical protein PsYK624_167590 [Phanerochaete sordida]